jgi:hypothetical protein
MTVLSAAQIVGNAMPSLAPAPSFSPASPSSAPSSSRSAPPSVAPSSSGPAGVGLGGAIRDTWERRAEIKAKTATERREALKAARAKVEARSRTKAERLFADEGKASRHAGSPKEREITRGKVAKAIAQLADAPTTKMWNDPAFREACAKLRRRYPDRALSEMLEIGESLTQALRDDPVAAREQLMAAYARLPISAAHKQVDQAKGLRGDLQRARQTHEDMQDLQAFAKKYGKQLPDVVMKLEALDAALAENAPHASAKIAARFGAPAVPSEVPAYEQKIAHKKMGESILEGVHGAIAHGIIDGDEAHLNTIAEVMAHPSFPWPKHRAERGQHFALYALRHAHEVALQLRAKSKPTAEDRRRREAGTKSIHGGPGPGQGGRESRHGRGTGGIRDSIRRVREAM